LSASFTIGGRVDLRVRRHPTALDHEVRDDAVEDGSVVEAVVDVAQEVLDRPGRLVRVELDADLSQGGLQHDHGLLLGCGAPGEAARRREEHGGEDDAEGRLAHPGTVANAAIGAPRRAAGGARR
jgi:hypothetical protein